MNITQLLYPKLEWMGVPETATSTYISAIEK